MCIRDRRWYAMAARHGGNVATEIVAGRLLFWPYREAPPVPLRTHLACGGPRRFRIDLQPGNYVVRVVTTMPSWTNRNFLVSGMVACNGAVRLLDAPMDKGSLVARDFAATVSDDRRLELTFGGATGWGVAAGMLSGVAAVIAWRNVPALSALMWELLPAFVVSTLTIVVVSLLDERPGPEVEAEFDLAAAYHVPLRRQSSGFR